ncbi:acyl-CoA dehydrogenase family protein [Nocardioides alcanivorans]|uniref:acyl-CoA dehydrogenase family protein n=1 Tax=Nocardioides alcanivorans TaxID=2897352 RepID=UPI001F1ED2F5|nr:acyl-CoA dehydrogenase family protein [Nocardioides alcanivorans]
MKLVPSQEELDLRGMLHDLLDSACPTTLVRSLREPGADRFPAELWKSLTAAGVLGLPFAEAYGGMDGRLDDVATYLLEAGRSLAPSVVVNTVSLGIAIDRLGDDALRSRVLPGICAGELRGTIALADPGDAHDVRPRLTAERDGDGWRVSGRIDHVCDVDLADRIFVTAAADGHVHGMLLVPDATGVEVAPLDVMGGPGQFRVVLDRVRIDAEDATGPLAVDDLRRVSHTLSSMRCVELVGVAEEAMRRAVDHARERHQFGRPIGSFQAAQHLIADMHIGVQAARLSALAAVAACGRGELAVRESAVARMHATTAAKRATLDAHQLHGGMGYVLETDLHLWSERARVLSSLDGTADTAAAWLAEEAGLVQV